MEVTEVGAKAWILCEEAKAMHTSSASLRPRICLVPRIIIAVPYLLLLSAHLVSEIFGSTLVAVASV